MNLRRAAIMIACTLGVTAGAAQAQWPAPQQQSAAPSGFGPTPQSAPAGFGPTPQAAPGGFGPSPQSAPQGFGPSPQGAPGGFGPSAQPPSGGFGGPPQQQQAQQPPPCIQTLLKLRDEAQKKAQAIQHASERKVPPQEACGLFNAFSAAEVKMIKYATDNAKSCGIPEDLIGGMKKGHARTTEIRTRVCQAAARPQGPAGPSLSDALTAPVPDSKNIKSGGGTFDTLSGTPLGRQ